MDSRFRHTAESVRRDIESALNKVGLLCRVFGRGKDPRSIEAKLNREKGKYSLGGKLIQDAIGIRIALYFAEDVHIVEHLLSSEFALDKQASNIDIHATDQFTVTRHNLVYRSPERYVTEMRRNIGDMPIDTAFEVQLRSVLSEGWHEVDHDLRYKSKENWKDQDDLSRALNGIMATLETSEWSMRKIFDELAYRHYRHHNWTAMLHCLVRMRASPHLSDELSNLLDKSPEIAKDTLRISRAKVIHKLANLHPSIPISLDNIVYVWNYIEPKDADVLSLTPSVILDALAEAQP